MKRFFFFIRQLCNWLLLLAFLWLMLNAELSIYLLKMAKGQLSLIYHTEKIEDVLKEDHISKEEKNRILFVQELKKYSVDSLGYKPTRNFTTYYEQHGPVLWVVTACEPFSFKSYEWEFPIVGKVGYKGFFNEYAAFLQYKKLKQKGYDADVSPVSAWSTLGWLPDPILSNMLGRSKARMANLFFHELFHATYYAKGTVDVNENLANFIAHKAVLRYFKNDTVNLNQYLRSSKDDSIYNDFTFKGYESLKQLYASTSGEDTVSRLRKKKEKLMEIYLQGQQLPLFYPDRYRFINKDILTAGNDFFAGARRYDGLYDSLNLVFNQKYRGDLKRMIEDLKK